MKVSECIFPAALRVAGAAILALALNGCMLASTPRVRHGSIDSNQYVATDARQRVVTSVEVGTFSRPGRVDPNQIVCTEPSPDAASAIATQLGGALSVIG